MESASSCLLCGKSDRLYSCSRCRGAIYCSKEHQKQHWKVHKLLCNKGSKTEKLEVNCVPQHQSMVEAGVKNVSDVEKLKDEESSTELFYCDPKSDIAAACSISTESGSTSQSSPASVPKHSYSDPQSTTKNTSDSKEHLEDGFEYTFVNSESSFLLDKNQDKLEDTFLEMGSVSLVSESSKPEKRWQSSLEDISHKQSTIPPPFLHQSFNMDKSSKERLQCSSVEWMTQICHYVVRDLEKYGICVVDNFVGKERAELIHRSVSSMYHSGIFVEGETVSSSLETTKKIRSDKIAWVDGTEKNCVDIAYLISTVDTIIMNSIRMKGNGQLGQRTIGGRTKVCCFFIVYFLYKMLQCCTWK